MNWTKANGMSAAEIDAKRKEFLAACGFTSLTEVDRTDGFTKVLKELLVMQGTDLQAAREVLPDGEQFNQARVLRNQILTELIPCLELYIADVQAYVTEIIEAKTRHWTTDRPARGLTLLDLDAVMLKQVQFTLAARLNAKRKAAGDTGHEMKMKAGVPCQCATFCRAKVMIEIPALPVDNSMPVEHEQNPY